MLDEIYNNFEIRFNLILRNNKLSIENLLNNVVEMLRFIYVDYKDIEIIRVICLEFFQLYCEKNNLENLKDLCKQLLPEFMRLFIGACNNKIGLKQLKIKKKKKFLLF
jgi:hypothetical protein